MARVWSVIGKWKKVLIFLCGFVMGFLSRQIFTRHQSCHEPDKVSMVEKRDGYKALKYSLYRDYVPRKVFVNCGGTVPSSIKLFLGTYPDAGEYDMYTFLRDVSYAALYVPFRRHTLYAATMAHEFNGNATVQVTQLGAQLPRYVTVKAVDMAKWLQKNVHPDDQVILKVDSELEDRIVERIVAVGVEGWIDKYYTATEDSMTLEKVKALFNNQRLAIARWQDEMATFSDFESVNPPRGEFRGVVVKTCASNDGKSFPLLFYASKVTSSAARALQVLWNLTRDKEVPVTVFVTMGFLESAYDLVNRTAKNLGFYFMDGLYTGSDRRLSPSYDYYRTRNEFVAAENLLRRKGRILEDVFVRERVDRRIVNRAATDRRLNVFSNATDVSDAAVDLSVLKKSTELSGRVGQYFSVDIGRPDSDVLVGYFLKKYGDQMIPLRECVLSHS